MEEEEEEGIGSSLEDVDVGKASNFFFADVVVVPGGMKEEEGGGEETPPLNGICPLLPISERG